MNNERISSLFFLLLSLFFLVASFGMPIGKPSAPGAGFLPLFLAVIMVLVSGGIAWKAFIRPQTTSSEALEKGEVIRIVLLVVGFALYCALLSVVGFYVLSLLYLIYFMKLFSVPKWWTILLVAIITTVCSYFLFELFLQIPFPKGIWWPY
jgi:hypothetical protein